MKKLYILIVAVCFGAEVFAQNPIATWAQTIGGSTEDYPRKMCTDSQGNLYVGGNFSGTVDFDPGSGTAMKTSLGWWDGFVAKYDANGNFQWVAALGGSADNDAVMGLTADLTGVWVTGWFVDEAYFDEGLTVSRTSNGSADIFVAKYDASDGELIFVNTTGSTSGDFGTLVAIDDDKNVYLAGEFHGFTSFDPLSSSGDRIPEGATDMYLAKYDAAGNYQWVNVLGSADGDDIPKAIAVSPDGASVYIGGYFVGFFYYDPLNHLTGAGASGNTDGFYGQYDASNGAYIWHSQVRSTQYDYVMSLAVDENGVYAGGLHGGSPTEIGNINNSTNIYSNGGTDGFIVRHDPATKDIIWVNSIGSSAGNDYLFDMALQGASVYAVGSFSAPMDVDPSVEGETILENTSPTYDAYMVKYNWQNGDFVSGQSIGGTGTDEAWMMAVSQDAVYWGGIFDVDLDLDPGEGFITGNTMGGTDMFFGRFDAAEPNAPSNLVFSNVTEESVTFEFVPPAVKPDGYIYLYKVGSDATGVPVDGTLYSFNERVGNSWVLGTTLGHDGTFSVLPGLTYHLSIYAYNGSGNGINYTSVALTGNVTSAGTNPDNEAPDIQDNTPNKAAPNSPVLVSVVVTDDMGVADVRIAYYPINSIRSGVGTMVLKDGTDDVYEYEIPASFNTEQGVEYAITAEDIVGNVNDPSFRSVIVEHTGTGLAIPYAAGTAQTNYRIISVPLNLQNNKVSDVFADDLGPEDKSKYRVFRYSGGATTELSASSLIELGKGYWFIAAESKTLNSGPGTTAVVGAGTPLTIPISNGWNQIGNPFNFDVDWNLVLNHAANEDKTIGDFKTYSNGFNVATTLSRMSGGFVMIQEDGDEKLRIPVFDDSGDDRIIAPVNFHQPLASNTWAVDLVLESGSFKNTFAGVGMHPEAKEQNDKYDDFTLPRFFEYLELNHNKKLYGSPFTKDIVPTSTQHAWEFEIDSNLPNEVVEINWDNSYFGSTDLQLVLWDVSQQRAVDMKAENKYTFLRNESHSFKVFFGDESFVKTETLPFRAVFHSASPVPSTGNITFGFSVPESAGQEKTSLIIYNLMGQKTANLIDKSLPAGYHEAVWNIEDGTKPATGVYISVLKFGETTLQKRLIVK